ncbi:MAG TPA: hypothetical protein VGC51_02065, partial [Hansschlegelia sp.]
GSARGGAIIARVRAGADRVVRAAAGAGPAGRADGTVLAVLAAMVRVQVGAVPTGRAGLIDRADPTARIVLIDRTAPIAATAWTGTASPAVRLAAACAETGETGWASTAPAAESVAGAAVGIADTILSTA